jgi:hypothetical protein
MLFGQLGDTSELSTCVKKSEFFHYSGLSPHELPKCQNDRYFPQLVNKEERTNRKMLANPHGVA